MVLVILQKLSAQMRVSNVFFKHSSETRQITPRKACICMFCRASLLKMTKGVARADFQRGVIDRIRCCDYGMPNVRRKDGSATEKKSNISPKLIETGFCFIVCVCDFSNLWNEERSTAGDGIL